MISRDKIINGVVFGTGDNMRKYKQAANFHGVECATYHNKKTNRTFTCSMNHDNGLTTLNDDDFDWD